MKRSPEQIEGQGVLLNVVGRRGSDVGETATRFAINNEAVTFEPSGDAYKDLGGQPLELTHEQALLLQGMGLDGPAIKEGLRRGPEPGTPMPPVVRAIADKILLDQFRKDSGSETEAQARMRAYKEKRGRRA